MWCNLLRVSREAAICGKVIAGIIVSALPLQQITLAAALSGAFKAVVYTEICTEILRFPSVVLSQFISIKMWPFRHLSQPYHIASVTNNAIYCFICKIFYLYHLWCLGTSVSLKFSEKNPSSLRRFTVIRADPGICERRETLPSLSLFISHLPFLSSPLEVGPLRPARGPGEALYMLLQWSPGWSPGRKRIRCTLKPLESHRWQSFYIFWVPCFTVERSKFVIR